MGKFKKEFNAMTWLLIPVAIVINGAVGWIVTKLDFPLYLDTIGTVLVAATVGPFAGAVTGLLTIIVLGIFSPAFLPYWPAAMLIGLAAGILSNMGWFRHWWKALLAGFIISVIASTASALIAMQIHGSIDLDPSYFLLKEPVDKTLIALVVFAAIQILPKWFVDRLPNGENVISDKE